MPSRAGTKSTRASGGGAWWKDPRLLVGMAISVGSVVLLLWNMDWDRFWAALRGAEYWWLFPSLASLMVAVFLKVLRWWLLLLPIKRVSRTNVFYTLCIAYLVNTVLPGRLGELARFYLLARLEGVSSVAVMSTVAVDRILDIVALALLLAVAIPTAALPREVILSGMLVGAGGVCLLAIALALAYPRGQALFLRLLRAVPAFPGKGAVERQAGELCLGMEGLRGATAQLRVGLATAAIWLVSVLIYYFGQFAFHIEAPLWAAVMVTALTNLVMVAPSSPGYVGVFHYAMVVALGMYGVGKETALSYAVVIHLAETGLLSVLGVFALWRCGISLLGWRDEKVTEAAIRR